MYNTEYVIILRPIPHFFFFNCWMLQTVLPAPAGERNKKPESRVLNSMSPKILLLASQIRREDGLGKEKEL